MSGSPLPAQTPGRPVFNAKQFVCFSFSALILMHQVLLCIVLSRFLRNPTCCMPPYPTPIFIIHVSSLSPLCKFHLALSTALANQEIYNIIVYTLNSPHKQSFVHMSLNFQSKPSHHITVAIPFQNKPADCIAPPSSVYPLRNQ